MHNRTGNGTIKVLSTYLIIFKFASHLLNQDYN